MKEELTLSLLIIYVVNNNNISMKTSFNKLINKEVSFDYNSLSLSLSKKSKKNKIVTNVQDKYIIDSVVLSLLHLYRKAISHVCINLTYDVKLYRLIIFVSKFIRIKILLS